MLTIRIDKDLHKTLKRLAIDLDTTVQALTVQALKRLIEEQSARPKGN